MTAGTTRAAGARRALRESARRRAIVPSQEASCVGPLPSVLGFLKTTQSKTTPVDGGVSRSREKRALAFRQAARGEFLYEIDEADEENYAQESGLVCARRQQSQGWVGKTRFYDDDA